MIVAGDYWRNLISVDLHLGVSFFYILQELAIGLQHGLWVNFCKTKFAIN